MSFLERYHPLPQEEVDEIIDLKSRVFELLTKAKSVSLQDGESTSRAFNPVSVKDPRDNPEVAREINIQGRMSYDNNGYQSLYLYALLPGRTENVGFISQHPEQPEPFINVSYNGRHYVPLDRESLDAKYLLQVAEATLQSQS
jgi:hypothetical protein